MKLAALVLAFMVGACAGFAFGTWLLFDQVSVGPPKYKTKDLFRGIPPTMRVNGYGHEKKQWEMRCIGTSKDCVHEIPVPGTVWLIVSGLVVLGVKFKCRKF